MKKRNLLLLLAVYIASAFQSTAIAQDTAKPKKEFRNSVHFNITNPVIFSRTFIVGYERVLNNHRSFSINVGQTGFPTLNLGLSDSLKAKGKGGKNGFHLSGDYRFYLSKENKYNAPRGIYIGPYFSVNRFKNNHSWDLTSTSDGNVTVESETRMNMSSVGIELGYQFVLWNRVSLDMILVGPGIAAYKLETKLGSNLSEEDKQKLFEEINNALAEKFPGYNVVIDDGDYKKRGTASTTSFGFRYLIQVGFRF